MRAYQIENQIKTKPVWAIREAAQLIGCNYFWLYRRVQSGELKAVKRGGSWLILAEDLLNFLGVA